MPDSPYEPTPRATRIGVAYGVAAYFFWGFFPLFFKQLGDLSPVEILSHRIVWSMVTSSLLLAQTGRWLRVWDALKGGKTLATLCLSTLLIAVNWLVFIYAVNKGEVLQSSLGYFITPLVSVLLGVFFLKERLRRVQGVSLSLALIGVTLQLLHTGELPWISLILAVTFALYGFLRKIVSVDALTGLSVETLLLTPFALAYLLYLGHGGKGAFLSGSAHYNLFLPLAGLVTAVPLLWFAAATKRLRLTTIGFMQYLTPTMHFLQAVLLFREPFSLFALASFACIWCGLILYSVDAWRCLASQRK